MAPSTDLAQTDSLTENTSRLSVRMHKITELKGDPTDTGQIPALAFCASCLPLSRNARRTRRDASLGTCGRKGAGECSVQNSVRFRGSVAPFRRIEDRAVQGRRDYITTVPPGPVNSRSCDAVSQFLVAHSWPTPRRSRTPPRRGGVVALPTPQQEVAAVQELALSDHPGDPSRCAIDCWFTIVPGRRSCAPLPFEDFDRRREYEQLRSRRVLASNSPAESHLAGGHLRWASSLNACGPASVSARGRRRTVRSAAASIAPITASAPCTSDVTSLSQSSLALPSSRGRHGVVGGAMACGTRLDTAPS